MANRPRTPKTEGSRKPSFPCLKVCVSSPLKRIGATQYFPDFFLVRKRSDKTKRVCVPATYQGRDRPIPTTLVLCAGPFINITLKKFRSNRKLYFIFLDFLGESEVKNFISSLKIAAVSKSKSLTASFICLVFSLMIFLLSLP